MENPEWKKEMRKLESNEEFTNTLDAVTEMVGDRARMEEAMEAKFAGRSDEEIAQEVNKALQKSFDFFNSLSHDEIVAVKNTLDNEAVVNQMKELLGEKHGYVESFLEMGKETIDSDKNKETLAQLKN